MEKKNIIFNHTLEQYNKKYKNRNHRLLKYTKKEVEDFDKRNNTKTKNFLLEGHRWWFINNTYYEIPKPIRFTWFRNLNAGIQTGVCVLGAGVIATAITVPLVVLNNQAEPEVSIDSVDKVEWGNKHYDKDGNACLTIKGKDGNVIQSVTVTIDNYLCIENTDYTYTTSSGELVVKKACIDAHPGKINIQPVFKDPVVKKKMIVTRENKNIDLDDFTTEYTITAKEESGVEISDVTYTTAIEGEIKITGNKFKVLNTAKGGIIEISAKKDGYEDTSVTIELASYSKITFDDNKVQGKNENITGSVVIPSSYYDSSLNQWKEVNSFTTGSSGDPGYAFKACSKITSVTIPNTITTIVSYCFMSCNSLTTINIDKASKLNNLGSMCFEGAKLNRFYIPSGILANSLKASMFGSCSSIVFDASDNKNYTTSDDGKILYNADKTSLICGVGYSGSSFTIPNSVIDIKSFAFMNCNSLNSITIPTSVTKIESNAFNNCDNLSSAIFKDPNNWNAGGTAITEDLSIPATAATCLKQTYSYLEWNKVAKKVMKLSCDRNVDLYFTEYEHSITATEENAGEVTDVTYSTESSDITITGNKFTVNEEAKGGSVVINAKKEGYKDASIEIELGSFYFIGFKNDEVYYDDPGFSANDLKIILPTRYFDSSSNDWIVPFTKIKENGFTAAQGNLKSIVVPGTVTEIGSYAFNNCTNLASVTLSEGLTRIGTDGGANGNVFLKCEALGEIIIPSSVKNMGRIPFDKCKNLKIIDFSNYSTPTDLPKMDGNDSYDFGELDGLEKIYVKDATMGNALSNKVGKYYRKIEIKS